ncbi:HXXEE domain-containing protein [Pseudoxanthobacter sp. M-2]|uniref:HXXEE domain-containing protein n=1 Tax=Pseudoxanthobacter sp. M-2 TaxID=3078754 RepID=UPI0038FC4977
MGRTATTTAPVSVFLQFHRFIWALPLAYAIHIPEEYFAGFTGWMGQHLHSRMTDQGFLLNNAAFMIILLSLTLWASRSRSSLSAFVFLGWASGNLFWNFVFHLVTTIYVDSYSPGLVTASLLYYPIAIWAAVLAVRCGRLGVSGAVGAFAIGAGLMLFVIWAGLLSFELPFA